MTLALLFAIGCSGTSTTQENGARAATLVYTGNVDGEIEPCG